MSVANYDEKTTNGSATKALDWNTGVEEGSDDLLANDQNLPCSSTDRTSTSADSLLGQGASTVDGGRCKQPPKNDDAERIVALEIFRADETEPISECGIGVYRPECLQKFASRRWMLFWMCWFCFVQGILVNGLVPSVLTTIERRYNFRASTLGRIMQWYDIGYVLCCIPVSYFGGRHSKPLVLGLGLLIMGVGSFLFSLPHIISSTHVYQEQNSDIDVCSTSASTTSLFAEYFGGNVSATTLSNAALECKLTVEQDTWWAAIERYRFEILFCVAHLLHGIGATPLFTLGVSYIDENVKPTLSPLYIGIFYTVVIFGPAIGFVMSATFLRFHTDFLSIERPVPIAEIDESDPNWVGAWWIGFQIASILSLFAVFPILSFPKILPSAEKYLKNRIVNSGTGRLAHHPSSLAAIEKRQSTTLVVPVEVVDGKRKSFIRRLWSDVQHIPAAVRRLLTNPSYMCITLSAACEGLLITGLSTFMAKYLERQFNVHPSRANLLIGCIMIPFAGLGTFVSGYVVKRFRLTCTKTLKYCICMAVLSALLSPMFLVYCEPARLAGVETHYPNDHLNGNETVNRLHSECNKHCICDPQMFHPVCATSKTTEKRVAFFSSCYAGCPESFHRLRKEFSNCTCAEGSKVEAGWCESKCSALIGFLILFAPMVYCTFSVGVPALSVVLRCVDYDERSFALGIQWILIRCIGTIPAPAIFAWLFDVSCLVRKTQLCDSESDSSVSTGSCLIYDNKMLADLFLAFTLIGKTVALLFLILALIFYRRSGREDFIYDDTPRAPDSGVELVEFSPSHKQLTLTKS